jgi:hypothetical protein
VEKHDNIPEETRDEKLESFAKRNESKKKLLKYLSIPAVIIAIIVFAVVCFVFFFKVRTIEVKGASKYNAQTLVIASEIEIGENLYSFDEDTVKENLTLNYPYISDVNIVRRWPDKVILEIKEESASYVTEMYGETLILSESLRVLENPQVPAESYDLCYIIIPDIERALVGNKPVFTGNADYIMPVLEYIKASKINGNITTIDLRSKFDIKFLMGTMYKVDCGDTGDMKLKLDMTEKILASGHIKEGQKAELNVSNPDECTAIIGENAVIAID